jgi:hypothetical protein
MKKKFFFTLIITICMAVAVFSKTASSISITITAPYNGFNTGDTLFIYVLVSSPDPVKSVKGIVENDTVTLNLIETGYHRGFLNMSKQKIGLKVLKIVAENSAGVKDSAMRNFKYDKPPRFIVTYPQNYYSIEKQQLRISASATDDDSANAPSIDLYINGKALINTYSAIDTSIDLSPYLQYGFIRIKLSATDSDKKSDIRYFIVYIEPFELMNRELSLKKIITAMSDSLIIVGDANMRSVYNISQKKYTDLTPPKNVTFSASNDFLYKDFLFVTMKGKNQVGDSAYVYRNGTLKPIDEIDDYSAKGYNLTFNKESKLYYYNYISDQKKEILDSVLDGNVDITEDGEIAVSTYSTIGGKNKFAVSVLKGSDKIIVDNEDARFPVTDGKSVVYAKGDETRSICLFQNGKRTIISSDAGDACSKFWYAVNNGWVAYTKIGDFGQRQIWIIKPNGEEFAISQFDGDCYIISLSEDGRIVFFSEGFYFIGGYNMSSIQFAKNSGLIRWTPDGFYYTIGPFLNKVTNQKLFAVKSDVKPESFKLNQNYPNPFNPATTITYSIPENCRVKIKLYDILGKEVIKILDENKEKGNHLIRFNGSSLSSGVYFYRIEAGGFSGVKKMILCK